MKKYCTILLFICCLSLGLQAHAQYIFAPDEYLIYATVIDAWYFNNSQKRVVIKDHTASYTSLTTLEHELVYVRSRMPGLALETVNDFKAKNLENYSLEKFINQRSEYQIIKEGEMINLFEHDEGWGRFYSRYPNADGIITLSRVGFNIEKNQALLCLANQWNRYTGVGLYILITKQPDLSWKIKEKLRVWNSWLLDEIKP